MKNIRIFYLKSFIFGGKIFSIFEKACFCNITIEGYHNSPVSMNKFSQMQSDSFSSRKHAYIILTPLNPIFIQ